MRKPCGAGSTAPQIVPNGARNGPARRHIRRYPNCSTGQWPSACEALPAAREIRMEREGRRAGKGLIRAGARAGSRSDHRPAVARKGSEVPDHTVCECGAVFARKTWRRTARRRHAAARLGAVHGVCPACRQAANGQAFGRVILEGSYVEGHADELIRRIRNVAARAEFTQPERRLVEVTSRGSTLDVRTTSQKLAHRLAREIAKAFRGTVTYRWSANDGRLLAVWRRDEEES
jgi:hypothetical protein